MATVDQPSPGLHAAVLRTLLSSDPWSQSLPTAVSGLVEHLTVEEAGSLPEAIAGVLPAFQNDPERLRFAAEIAVRLDLYEVAGVLADLARGVADRQLMVAAAMLCGNPGADRSVRERLAGEMLDDPVGRIGLDRHAARTTADETRLHHQRWPGVRAGPARFALAPVVVLDEKFRADSALKFAVRLVEAGATVRRLPTRAEIPFWFGAQTVLVCRALVRTRVLSRYPGFPEAQILVHDEIPFDDRGVGRLIRQIDAVLPGQHRLRLSELEVQVATRVWDPEVFMAGVYSIREAAFLTGASTASLYYLLKKGVLTPLRPGRRRALLTFRDVVAVRTWSYLKTASPRVSSAVVKELVRFGGDVDAVGLGVVSERDSATQSRAATVLPRSASVDIGATSGGRILVNHGDGWVDMETGQSHIDLPLTDIDEVFRPFKYGGGTTVDLLQASPNTKLYPTVLHGAPYLSGHRITAKALAGLYRHNGYDAIRETYSELANVKFEDTMQIGQKMLAGS